MQFGVQTSVSQTASSLEYNPVYYLGPVLTADPHYISNYKLRLSLLKTTLVIKWFFQTLSCWRRNQIRLLLTPWFPLSPSNHTEDTTPGHSEMTEFIMLLLLSSQKATKACTKKAFRLLKFTGKNYFIYTIISYSKKEKVAGFILPT